MSRQKRIRKRKPRANARRRLIARAVTYERAGGRCEHETADGRCPATQDLVYAPTESGGCRHSDSLRLLCGPHVPASVGFPPDRLAPAQPEDVPRDPRVGETASPDSPLRALTQEGDTP